MTKYLVKTTSITYKYVQAESLEEAKEIALYEPVNELEEYVEHHKEEIEAGDHHDPNALELFCDMHPDEPECLIYDD